MTTGSLKAIQFRAKNLKTGKVEDVTVETSHSNLAELATGRGWAAALNSFDVDCKMADGRSEGEAISELMDLCDYE